MPNEVSVSRHKSREQAFMILFEKCFNNSEVDEIIENAQLAREFVPSEFALELVKGIGENIEQLDNYIENNLKGWSMQRISKTALCILRLALYEMLFSSSVPVSVAINEAVKLAKLYSGDKDSNFINGLLGAVAKTLDRDKENE